MRKLGRWCALIGLWLPVLGAAAVGKADPLFASHDPLEITLTGPFLSIARDRNENPDYRPGTLGFAEGGAPKSFAIGIRPRGKSRRARDVCSFPPLRLNLPKTEMKGTLFDKQDKLKLVTHCKTNERHQQVLLREYLAYRIFNRLTDASFKVRLVKADYVDEDRAGRVTTRFGFFIEDKGRLARRLGTELVVTPRIDRKRLAPEATSLAELFQYLISNTDFSFIAGPAGDSCCHNAVPLAGAAGQVIPVPYDFDVSGLVDAPYALPQEELKQRSVRDRLFRGFCRPARYLDAAVATMQAARVDLYALIAGQEGLDDVNRRQVTRFVDSFYAILDDKQSYQRNIANACRGHVVQ